MNVIVPIFTFHDSATFMKIQQGCQKMKSNKTEN